MIVWNTKQKGAVGRMKTTGLELIIDRLDGAYSVQPHGKELLTLLRSCYQPGDTIQQSTFKLVHAIFARFGLLVVIPDNARFKRELIPVFEADLFHQKPADLVRETISSFPANYKVQANPRAVNLFYLKDDLRGRIEKKDDRFVVLDSEISFSASEIRAELHEHPERFSPNVILRGLLQSTILPDIAFIGGGGEMAYWLELRRLFEAFAVPFPMLVLRNSFLIVDHTWSSKLDKNELTGARIFQPADDLINDLVRRESATRLNLEPELIKARKYYEELKNLAGDIDHSLLQHIDALQARAIKPLKELEKKFMRAEKRKYIDQSRQIRNIKSVLFPQNNLQERVENFMPYYAKWGKDFIDLILTYSLALEQQFVVLKQR